MNSSDWKLLTILSGGPGVVAISLGAYVYSYQPYGYIGPWLMSMGVSGVLFALLSLDSAPREREKLSVPLGVSSMRVRRSTFSLVMIGLLAFNMTATVYLTTAILSFPVSQFCYCPSHEQINILGATINITDRSATFGISNSGTNDVVLVSIGVTGGSYVNQAGTISRATVSSSYAISTICIVIAGQATIPKETSCTLAASFAGGGGAFVAGTTYSFKVVSKNGDTYPYTTTA